MGPALIRRAIDMFNRTRNLTRISAVLVVAAFGLKLLMIAWQAWQCGDIKLAVATIAIIPFGFACWGLSNLIAGAQLREIARNLTDEERTHVEQLAAQYVHRMGLRLIPVGLIASAAYWSYGLVACVAVAAIGLVAGIPFGIRQFRQQRDYLMNTEYARAHFSDPPNANVSV